MSRKLTKTPTTKITEEMEADLATKLTAHIEVFYNINKRLPTQQELISRVENCPEAKLRQLVINSVNPKLKARGVPQIEFEEPETPSISFGFKKADDDLDPLFVLACNSILDPGNSKTFNAKIKELSIVGITSNTWNSWMQIPKYASYAQKVFYERFDQTLDMQADMALARNIQAGDLQSIKYYKELTGKFRPQSENSLALGAMITIFMEIIAKYISHDVIDVVAEELERSPVGELFRLPGEVKPRNELPISSEREI